MIVNKSIVAAYVRSSVVKKKKTLEVMKNDLDRDVQHILCVSGAVASKHASIPWPGISLVADNVALRQANDISGLMGDNAEELKVIWRGIYPVHVFCE